MHYYCNAESAYDEADARAAAMNAPTVAAQQCGLDPRAHEAAAAEYARHHKDGKPHGFCLDVAITAYLSHVAGDVAGLVETLRSPSVACPCREFRHEVATALSATQAENAGLKRDAERWRALLRCARIRMQGSAGFNPKTGERQEYSTATGQYEKSDRGWVHFGAEFWSVYPGAEDEDRANRWGTHALTALADDVLLKEADAARSALAKEVGREG